MGPTRANIASLEENGLEFILHIRVVLLNVGQWIVVWKHGYALGIPPGRVGWLIRDIIESSEPVNLVRGGVPALIGVGEDRRGQHIPGRPGAAYASQKNTITAAQNQLTAKHAVRNAKARIEVRPDIVPGSSPKAVCSELNVLPFVQIEYTAAILRLVIVVGSVPPEPKIYGQVAADVKVVLHEGRV